MPAERVTTKIHRIVSFAVSEYGLEGSSMVIGVSGGPDSTALMHSLLDIQQSFHLKLHGANLNHGLQGESDEVSGAVAAKFISLGVPYTVERRDVLDFKRKFRLSEEDAARRVRYKFFADVIEESGANILVTGHTADDQAETVLMHILRGSGLDGISGMRIFKQQKLSRDLPKISIFRPLLWVTKDETLRYCQELGVDYYLDKSNLLTRYNRNRVRHELLPYLGKFNPQIRFALCRLADIASGYAELVGIETERIWPEAVTVEGDRLILQKAVLLNQPVGIQREIIRRAIIEMSGDLDGVRFGHINEAIRLLKKDSNKTICLPGGLLLKIRGGEGVFEYPG